MPSFGDILNAVHDESDDTLRVKGVSGFGGSDPVGLKNVALATINPATEDTLALAKARLDLLLAESVFTGRIGEVQSSPTANTVLARLKDLLTGIVLGTGGNNIGDVDVLTLPSPISGPGNPTIDSYTSAAINLAANTANQSIISAPGANKQIWIYGLFGTANVAGTISVQDEDDTARTGVMPVGVTGGWVIPLSGNFAMPWIKFATNKAVEIDTVTCEFDGLVAYAIVSV